jgi:replicative DNA helicase|tara:strand:- start:422 stop:1789 length:1368 start_codon:yes stop_codon:yes gene_type:complete
MSEQSTLIQFGTTFQSKTLSSLLGDQKFLQTISDILEPEYFDSDANKWIAKTIREYFFEYKSKPTLEVMKVKISEIENDILKVSVVDNLKEAWRYIESTDLKFVQEQTLEFCRNQVMKTAIMNSVDLIEVGQYDQIKKLVDNAMKAGQDRDLGHDYIDGMEERLNESARKTVKTGWDPIDDVMDGGLGSGELGVVVAPAGIGKSWCLQTLGSAAVKAGLNVVHYTLELNENYVGLRYDTVFSGITTSNIKFYQDDVKKKIDQLTGTLLIKYFPTKSASVQTLTSHLSQIELQGNKPDLVLVDYADILKGIGTEKRHVLENIYEDLRGLAGEMDCPIWTASQANRSSLEEEVIDATKVAEAYSKVMIADFVVSVSRKVEDKIANTGRFHVIKNRFGPDGITYPSSINTNIGKIDVYESTTQGGQDAQGKMDNSQEFMRKTLSEKKKMFEKDVSGFE